MQALTKRNMDSSHNYEKRNFGFKALKQKTKNLEIKKAISS